MVREERRELAIIGGGASGLAAAVQAGELAGKLGLALDVTVYERDDRMGRPILATGNGRCNFSNRNPGAGDYRHPDFVEDASYALLYLFSRGATDRERKLLRQCGSMPHLFFHRHGLLWRAEEDGRNYPRTGKASTVVDVLRAAAARVGVVEACEREVVRVAPPMQGEGKFTLHLSDRQLARADRVIVACGGRGIDALDACGLPCEPLQPMLGPLRCAEASVTRELDNIRVRCRASLHRQGRKGEQLVRWEEGELLFRKYGVSGICVFNLSRYAKPGDSLRICFLADDDMDEALHFLYARRKLLVGSVGEAMTCADMMRGLLLPRVAEVVLKAAGLAPQNAFAKADVPALAQALVAFPLTVEGVGDASICQVRRGGLPVSLFDVRTLEARDVPGLYAAGEALDVDAACGGFNLHWAWTSGLLAAYSAVYDLAGGWDGR